MPESRERSSTSVPSYLEAKPFIWWNLRLSSSGANRSWQSVDADFGIGIAIAPFGRVLLAFLSYSQADGKNRRELLGSKPAIRESVLFCSSSPVRGQRPRPPLIRKDVMRNAMRTIERVGFILFALVAPALAQNQRATEPAPAAAGPAYDMSVGYANVTMAMASAQHVNLSGLDVGGSAHLNSRWGAMVDSTYVRTPDVLGTRHAGYQLSFLGGPVFYPFDHGKTRFSVHALAGATLVDGAVPINTTDYFHGWLVRFSYAAGGGIERPLSGPFGVRVQADYLHSAFFDAQGAVRPQNNLRLMVSLVLRLRERQ